MLSIIIPVYNGENYLENCVESILGQNYKDFEIIIVNDGSVDNTKKICDDLVAQSEKIKVFHSENKGVSYARNKGLEIAIGDYISFIDCDDRISEQMYVEMMEQMISKDLDISICSYTSEFNDHIEDNIFSWEDRIFNDSEIKENISINMVSKIKNNGTYNNVIMGSVCRAIFKNKVIKENEIKFDSRIKFAEDLVFFMECLKYSSKVYTTNKCYYFYNRKTDLQLSTTQKHIVGFEENFNLVDKKVLEILNIPNFENTKVWALRKITNIYSLVVNASSSGIDMSIKDRKKEIKNIIKRNDFYRYLNCLGSNEYYGLNKFIVTCLKYRLYSIVIKHYLKITS